jgi:D-arabinose 1-dehydrogenase-like Zn-dependent alcohol dehydrogenase
MTLSPVPPTVKDFCGKCADCLAHNYKFCEDQDMCGVTSDGAFAEYAACDYRSVVRLPDSLSFDTAAPLACAGTTILTAIKACKLEKGQRLCILGGGALGHLGVQISKTMGFETVLVDAREPPLDLCRKLKYAPDVTFNSSKTKVDDQGSVQEAVKARGGYSDAVIVTTDAIPAFTLGLELTKKHGLLMVVSCLSLFLTLHLQRAHAISSAFQVGQPEPPIPIPFHHLIFRDLTIKGSLLGNPKDFRELCELVVEKGIEVKTRAYDLKDVPQLIEDYHKDSHAGKLVVRVSE